MRWVTYLVLHQDKIGQPMEEGTHIITDAPYIEFKLPLERVLAKPSPRMFTSHLPIGHVKHYITDKKVKMINVRRQIPDTLTSLYHFYQTNPFLGNFQGSFDDFFKLFESKSYTYGDPIQWNQEWWDARGNENILFVSFEEMKRDIHDVIRKVAKFLEKDIDEVTVNKIAEATTISAMKVNPYIDPAIIFQKLKVEEMTADQFFRKGVVGDWKKHFSAEQTAYIKERMKETNVPYG